MDLPAPAFVPNTGSPKITGVCFGELIPWLAL